MQQVNVHISLPLNLTAIVPSKENNCFSTPSLYAVMKTGCIEYHNIHVLFSLQ